MRTVRFGTVSTILLLALLLPVVAGAYTTPGTGVVWSVEDLASNSGGVITWDDVAQAYVSSEAVTISATDSVTIFSDFKVDVAGGTEDITVFGMLQVGDPAGAATDSVAITGDDDGDGPGGFKVEEGGTLYMERVILIGGGADGIDDGVRLSGGTAYLEGCRVSNWPGYAARSSSSGHLVIRHTLFHDNMEYTLSANTGSTLEMVGDTLVRNNMATPGSGKTAITIGIQGNNVGIIDSCYISGTEGNRQGGIAVWNLTGTSQEATITNTTVEDCAFGINVQGGGAHAVITDCLLQNNTAYDNPMVSGSGISVYAGGTLEASHNEITGNYWGITVPSGDASTPATVVLGEDGATEYAREGFNRIHDNGNTGATWGLYNNSANDVLAQNNYWGTTDENDIAEWIFDSTDDPSKGTVVWAPFWDGQEDQQPPVLVSVEPDSDAVNVWDDWYVYFAADANDPDGDNANLVYQWTVQGDDWGSETSIIASFMGEGTIPVILTVTDEQGLTVTRSWDVILHGPSDLMTLSSTSPDSAAPQIVTGESIDFSIAADTPSGAPALFTFFFDGSRVSETSSWSHTFDTEGTFRVYADAVDTVSNPSPAAAFVWEVTVSANAVDEPRALPAQFSLATYPNPFNAELRMNYALPRGADVTVAVYDVLGRQVRNMELGQTPAGRHELAFDAHDLASGLYFVRFQAGDWQATRKVTLVR